MKAVRYWPCPQDPDEVLERKFETYDADIYVKFLSQRDETDYIIRELEVWKINKDGKVGFVYWYDVWTHVGVHIYMYTVPCLDDYM